MSEANSVERSFMRQVWGSARNMVLGMSAALAVGVVVLALSVLSAVNPLAVSPHQDANVASESAIVEYYLPYPGLLPDSPLYKLKAVRDKIGLWMTWDRGKKAEKELFLADKRIGAAMALLEGGKGELAVVTATKGEKYLEQAVNRAVMLNKEGLDVKSLLLQLEKAAGKHEELMGEIVTRSAGANKDMAVGTEALTSALHEKMGQVVLELE